MSDMFGLIAARQNLVRRLDSLVLHHGVALLDPPSGCAILRLRSHLCRIVRTNSHVAVTVEVAVDWTDSLGVQQVGQDLRRLDMVFEDRPKDLRLVNIARAGQLGQDLRLPRRRPTHEANGPQRIPA